MKLEESGESLVIVDNPGCHWIFGLFFVLSGSFALYMLVAANNRGTLPLWGHFAVVVVGGVHVAAGLWLIRRSPSIRTGLNRADDMGGHRLRAPGDRQPTLTTFKASEVRGVEVRRSKDSDGDSMFHLFLWLDDNRALPLHGQPMHGEEHALAMAAQIRTFLRLPQPRSTTRIDAHDGTAHHTR